MKCLVNSTNGFMILSDSFATEVFKQSFLQVFNKDAAGFLNMGFNATLEVITSKELKICGLIGPVTSANKKSGCLGETVIRKYIQKRFLIDCFLGNWSCWYLRLEIMLYSSKDYLFYIL